MRGFLCRLGLMVLAFAGTGCNGDSTGSSDGPQLRVQLSPKTVQPGGLVTLTLTIDRFTMEPPIGQPNAAGHGHLRVYIDDDIEDNYIAIGWDSQEEQFNIRPNTPPGAHFVRAELYNHDGSRLSPRVFKKINITVQ